jgi:hypothetical protein
MLHPHRESERAGVDFVDENGGCPPGVRLRNAGHGISIATPTALVNHNFASDLQQSRKNEYSLL